MNIRSSGEMSPDERIFMNGRRVSKTCDMLPKQSAMWTRLKVQGNIHVICTENVNIIPECVHSLPRTAHQSAFSLVPQEQPS